MKKLLAIFSLAFLTTQFLGCNLFKKADPKLLTELEKLPPFTQTGANTFGCLANGKSLVPLSKLGASGCYQLGQLLISGAVTPQLSGTQKVYIRRVQIILNEDSLRKMIAVGRYSLTEYPSAFATVYFEETNCNYGGKGAISGGLTIGIITPLRISPIDN